MSKQVVAEVIALIELGMIAPEDIVKCLRKANSEPEQALAAPAQEPVGALILGGVIDTNDGPEYEEWDVEWNTKAVEALQEKLVTSNGVTLMLYTTPPAQPAPVQEPVETADTLFRQFMSEANKAGITHWPTPPAAPVQEPVISNVGADANMLWPDKPFVPKGTGKITLHESKPN
jgi:hypothetical protein